MRADGPRHDGADHAARRCCRRCSSWPQPDLGSALVYVVGALALLFVAGAPWRHFAALGALGAVAITLVLVAAADGRRRGAQALPGGPPDRRSCTRPAIRGSEGYQQQQSGSPSARARRPAAASTNATQTGLNFLPEHHTDFIFAVVGETYGFAGAALVLSLYALLIWRGLAHPHGREEPVRRADRRRHHRDAAVPDLRERRDDRGDHADHRRPGPALELRRLVDARHVPGPRPAAFGPRAGARDRSRKGRATVF